MSAGRERRCAAPTTDVRGLAAIRRAVHLPAFQFLLILPTAAVVALVLVSTAVGLDHPSVNFGTVVTWVVWWGALLLSFLLFGRAWCLVCPLGAVGEWVQRLSPWWRWAWTAALDRPWPHRLRSLWPATLLFVVFVFLDNGYGMSNSPRLTAGLIVVIALAAAWVGLVFERRAFCRYLCPLTAFIGLNSLASVFELRCRDARTCRTRCATKDCFRGNHRRYGCPMGEFPGSSAMDTNLYCILCTECVRSCPHDNIALRFRVPGRDLWAMRRPRADGAFAACVIAGLPTVVPLLMLVSLPGVRRILAGMLPAGLPPNDPPRLVAIGLLFGLGLAASVGLAYGFSGLARWASGDPALATRGLFIRYAYALIPIGLVKWMADLLDHALRTWGALQDVTRALLLDFPWNRAMAGRATVVHLLSPTAVYAVQVVVLLSGLLLAVAAMHRISLRLGVERDAAFASFLPMAGLSAVLTVTNLWTLGLALL